MKAFLYNSTHLYSFLFKLAISLIMHEATKVSYKPVSYKKNTCRLSRIEYGDHFKFLNVYSVV